MQNSGRTRPRLGDVIEIPTQSGFGYAHYTHKHAQYGALLRFFGTLYGERPSDFRSVVTQPPKFTAFFPLGAACARGITTITANLAIAPPREFPIFRAGVADKAGTVECWWVWDGVSEKKVGALTPEIAQLPIRGVINDTLLIERILSGWRDAA